jgi:acyl-CoA synthetase (AMP-forming)/AMP-acid ligase II
MLNLGEIIKLNAVRIPHEKALVWNEVRLNYDELNRRTNSLANAIIKMGINRGDRVALCATNCHQFIETHIAVAKAGAILVPLNAMLAPVELTRLINHSGAKMLVFTSNFLKTVAEIHAELPDVTDYIAIGGGDGFWDYEVLIAASPDANPEIPFSEDDTAYITYTSGTTGLPKGVMLSVRNLFSNALNAIVSCLIPPGGFEVVGFPLFFSAIFNSHVIPYFLAGGGVIILDRFSPEAIIKAINREKPSYFTVNPTMLHDLVTHPLFQECEVNSLKGVLVCAAPLSLARVREAKKALGSILVQGYGQTECTSFATCTWPADYDLTDPVTLEKRVTSIGRAVPTLQVKVMNDQGEDVKNNGEEVGEIVIKGPSVMQGYWKQPEATAETLKNNWLYTGDLGTMDKDGFLWMVGRKKDMINSGGLKVYPEDVESVLYTNGKILEVAVVGRPDERWGETVTAFVVPKKGETLTEAEVIDYTKGRLAGYKKPTRVFFIDQLPRNASGKIKKGDLREKLIKEPLSGR